MIDYSDNELQTTCIVEGVSFLKIRVLYPEPNHTVYEKYHINFQGSSKLGVVTKNRCIGYLELLGFYVACYGTSRIKFFSNLVAKIILIIEMCSEEEELELYDQDLAIFLF